MDTIKDTKKRLKHAFKRQHQRMVLERRLQQSLNRGESELAEQTAQTLATFSLLDVEQQEVDVLQREATFLKEIRARHLRFILNIYQKLDLQDYSHDEARKLLYHMSKATASVDLFCQNQAALKGYTRQKFVERARLVANSIARVHFVSSWLEEYESSSSSSSSSWSTSRKQQLFSMCQVLSQQLHSIQSIASIGCGPGSDLTGALASVTNNNTTDDEIKNIVALDSSMDDWEKMVKEVLTQMKCTTTTTTNTNLFLTNCDIRIDPNRVRSNTTVSTAAAAATVSGLSQVASCGDHLLILISYVLCETRGEWYAWMDCLVDQCQVGTLWLLLEPTAWQLHIFRTRYQNTMDHLWLDTSMYRQDLQELETRNGPAVLLCRKRDQQR